MCSIMQQKIELTSKLVLAALIATVVFSAITVPSVVAQSTSSPPIRANSVTSGSIKDGEVKTADLANNAVTSPKKSATDGAIQAGDIADGVIPSGGIQLNMHIVEGSTIVLDDGELEGNQIDCPSGEIVTGGGYEANIAVQIMANRPLDENTWNVAGYNPNTEGGAGQFHGYAVCVDATDTIISIHPSTLFFVCSLSRSIGM